MSIVITSEGMDVALGRMQDVLEALGGKEAGIAIARALNRSIQAAGTRATRIAKTAYTAQYDELRANLEIRRANRSNLEGALNITGRPGMSLIHFLPDPDVPQPPAARPAAGVSVQIKKKGARHPATSNVAGGSKSFIIRKPQGGYGVFVRHGQQLEMLYGPSPVQALQTADAQEQVVARAEEVFPERLQHEVDVILSGIVGTGR